MLKRAEELKGDILSEAEDRKTCRNALAVAVEKEVAGAIIKERDYE